MNHPLETPNHSEESVFYSTTCTSPVGRITLASDGESLVGLWLEGQKHFGGTVSEHTVERPDLAVFKATKRLLKRYFEGKNPTFSDLPLAPAGGEFRKTVWAMLRAIPYGEVTTYGEIARNMSSRTSGTNTSARAVGGAVGRNPISIIVPCHRVVGADGGLTGYAGGIDNKIRLLTLEGVAVGSDHVVDLACVQKKSAWERFTREKIS